MPHVNTHEGESARNASQGRASQGGAEQAGKRGSPSQPNSQSETKNGELRCTLDGAPLRV